MTNQTKYARRAVLKMTVGTALGAITVGRTAAADAFKTARIAEPQKNFSGKVVLAQDRMILTIA